jgi:rhodanese-related sulfurtransferase
MKPMFTILFATMGVFMVAHGQCTDPGYAAKLKSLYKGTVTTIQPADLARMVTGNRPPLILDTRSPREFEVSHIPTAKFVDYKRFSRNDVENQLRDRVVVVYCTVGYRSERIGEQLGRLGFQNVFNLYGGIFEWVNQGHALVDAKGNPTTKVHAYSEDWGKWLLKGEKIFE